MNLLFYSDTLGLDGAIDRETFLDYLKYNDNFLKDVNFINDDLADNYVIFFDTFCGKTALENLLDNSKTIISHLQDGKCYILFFHSDVISHQFKPDHPYWIEFKELIKLHNIDEDRFGFVYYETVLNKKRNEVDRVGIDICSFNRNSVFSYHPNDKFLYKIFNNTKGYYRQFKYCSHNNNIKDHRVELLLFLTKQKLLEDGITTWFAGGEPKEQGVDDLDFTKFNSVARGVVDYSKEYGKEVVDFANNHVPNSYDLKEDGLRDWLNPIPYFNSYFNIITECSWGPGIDNNDLQKITITEKVWKPIVTFQPFILISMKGSLRKLREWGFKTFDGFIDESYDNLETYDERKGVIQKEISRLCSMTREELDSWYWSMEDILQHNSDNFIKFVDREHFKLEDIIKKGWSKCEGH
tara:strand:- start:6550 stop:7779 length:1230 start_codon:yes stop_codon:yes gene_type:complete